MCIRFYFWTGSFCWSVSRQGTHSLDIDVGTDKRIAEEEHLALFGLEDLTTLPIDGLEQRLAQDQLALV